MLNIYRSELPLEEPRVLLHLEKSALCLDDCPACGDPLGAGGYGVGEYSHHLSDHQLVAVLDLRESLLGLCGIEAVEHFASNFVDEPSDVMALELEWFV